MVAISFFFPADGRLLVIISRILYIKSKVGIGSRNANSTVWFGSDSKDAHLRQDAEIASPAQQRVVVVVGIHRFGILVPHRKNLRLQFVRRFLRNPTRGRWFSLSSRVISFPHFFTQVDFTLEWFFFFVDFIAIILIRIWFHWTRIPTEQFHTYIYHFEIKKKIKSNSLC